MLHEKFYDKVFTENLASKTWSFICVGNTPDFNVRWVIFRVIWYSTWIKNQLRGLELDFINTITWSNCSLFLAVVVRKLLGMLNTNPKVKRKCSKEDMVSYKSMREAIWLNSWCSSSERFWKMSRKTLVLGTTYTQKYSLQPVSLLKTNLITHNFPQIIWNYSECLTCV